MTYSIKIRAATRSECKQRLAHALATQTAGQLGHMQDRPHIERMLCALIDTLNESQHEELVVDAYGYVSVAGDGSLRLAALNMKVYSTPVGSEAIGGMQPPPPGTF